MAASPGVRFVLRWGSVLAVVGMAVCGASALLAWRWRQVPIGAGTTRITAPLAADGQVDYLAAINVEMSNGVTPENNAAPSVLRVVGMEGTATEWRATQLRELGMADPGAGMLASYAAWRQARGETVEDADIFGEPVQAAAEHVWTATDSPELAAYIQSQEAALDALAEAVRRQRFFMPAATADGAMATVDRPAIPGALLGAQSRLRDAGEALLARAMLRLGAGDAAGFAADALAASAFSRLMAQQPSMIEYLVARAANDAVLRTVEAAAGSEQLDAATAERLRGELAAVRWPTPAMQIDGYERYGVLDMLLGLSQGRVGSGEPEAGGISMVPVHFSVALAETNGFFDRERDAFGLAGFGERQRALLDIDRDVRALEASGTLRSPKVLGAMLIPSWVSLNSIVTEREAQERLALAALRLRVARATHGAYPETLEAGGIRGAEGEDPFVDRPLVYRREGTGYLLYSVGPDLADDGGMARPKNRQRASAGWDVVVRVGKPG